MRQSERGGSNYPYTLCVVLNRTLSNIRIGHRDNGSSGSVMYALGEEKSEEKVNKRARQSVGLSETRRHSTTSLTRTKR